MIRTVIFIMTFSLCVSAVWARDERSIKKLQDALVALAPDVDLGEAELLSVTAHTASRSLAREYGLVWSPIFQNFLIHMGKRQRGYCGHYARDIGERLKELKLKTLVLHWGAAFAGTEDESNCLVVTAPNQPFQDGIVIDGWRKGGRLFWCALKKDSEYDLAQGAGSRRTRATELFRAQRPERQPGYYGITAWKEDSLYTAWLHDYERSWEWHPIAR
ncbi:MAG: hypothetical protein DME61_06785 [Verrucomicrobia bacterium]|nr:MAG: hypothetical protein DME61_06785 [Verrucomicrobiota bacterium]